MWDFQGWVSSLRREPYSGNFPECLLALSHWRDSTVFIIGVPFGTVITRQNSDNRWFVDGVGAVFMGEAPGPLGSVVRKYKLPGADCSFSGFEVLFFFFGFFFLLLLKICPVLVWTDNTMATHINGHGATRSVTLQSHNLIAHIMSLSGTHIPGVLNINLALLS